MPAHTIAARSRWVHPPPPLPSSALYASTPSHDAAEDERGTGKVPPRLDLAHPEGQRERCRDRGEPGDGAHNHVNRAVPRRRRDRGGAAGVGGPAIEPEERVAQVVERRERRRHEPRADGRAAARDRERGRSAQMANAIVSAPETPQTTRMVPAACRGKG